MNEKEINNQIEQYKAKLRLEESVSKSSNMKLMQAMEEMAYWKNMAEKKNEIIKQK